MSKRKWHHPEVPAEERGTKVWRSAGELENTSQLRQWVDREFPRAAEMMSDENDRENTRRDFLKLMGASTALAGFGLASCRQPEKYIVPYANSVEWQIPGKPTFYASSMPTSAGAIPLVVTNHDGRPTKLEPNKQHPDGSGTGAQAQASVLDMYNPARSRKFLEKGQGIKRADAIVKLNELTKSGKFGVVVGEDDSHTRTRLLGEIRMNRAGAKFYGYEALAGQGRKESNDAIFGKGAAVNVDFSKAERILSVDSDFLELDPQGEVKSFFDRRRPEGPDYGEDPLKYQSQLNRLYCVEPQYSVTGGMADHRVPLAPSQMGAFLAQLAAELGVPGASERSFTGTKAEWIKNCAEDLKAHQSVVLLGSRYAKELHDIVYLINKQLGAIGNTVIAATSKKANFLEGVKELIKAIESKEIETLILATPANPFYENPSVDGKNFTDVVKESGVKVVHLGTRLDASANAADLHIPAAHYLESWGDAYTSTGVYTVIQPTILPLYGGIQELELLLALANEKVELFDSMADESVASPAYEAVKATFAKYIGSEKSSDWKQLLREGYFGKSQYLPATGGDVAFKAPASKPEPSKGAFDIIFATDSSVLDGRYVDNSWLQEAPDPISKLTWDNALYMSPQTAKDLDLYKEIVELEKEQAAWWSNLGIDTKSKYKTSAVSEDGEGPSLFAPMVKVTVNGQEIETAVVVSFGMADNVVAIPLGYGQGYDKHWGDDFKGGTPAFYDNEGNWNTANVSTVGVNRGFNGYTLRVDEDYFTSESVKVAKVDGKRYKLARTQEHHSMYGRALAREISTMPTAPDGQDKTKDYKAQLKGVRKQGMDSHIPDNISIYKQQANAYGMDGKKYDREHLWDKAHQWAMTVDLSTCTGCNACLVACQAENNIPVVGKTQVAMGREMHWIRMDRYFADPDNSHHGHDDHSDANKRDSWENPLEMIPNPVACVQCESAPCETVCPVNATVHSEDGLNTMAYNRCIGTRYCANNCPYKARRFNFFDYNKRNPLIHKNLYKGPFGKEQTGDAQHLQRNPNVSVRMRGVMEKCTYCVQRLQAAKIKSKQNMKKAIQKSGKKSEEFSFKNEEEAAKALRAPTNSVTVACQDACSSGAIVFGNIADRNDENIIHRTKGLTEESLKLPKNVQGEFQNPRTYDMLNYIGTRPRTSYMARVKNPNPKMKNADKIGRATIHMH